MACTAYSYGTHVTSIWSKYQNVGFYFRKIILDIYLQYTLTDKVKKSILLKWKVSHRL